MNRNRGVLDDHVDPGQDHPHDRDLVHDHVLVPGRAPTPVLTAALVQGVVATARNAAQSPSHVQSLALAQDQGQAQRGPSQDQDPGHAPGLVPIALPQRRENHVVAQNLQQQRPIPKKKSRSESYSGCGLCICSQYNWMIISQIKMMYISQHF